MTDEAVGKVEEAPPPDFKESLPEELRNDPTISRYKSAEELAKAYKEAKSKLGWDPTQIVKLPGDDAKPEDFDPIYKALGRPEQADKYEVPTVEGFKFDAGFIDSMKKAAFDNGIGKRQFEQLIKATGEHHKTAQLLANKKSVEAKDAFEKEMTEHWGDKAEANQKAIELAKQHYKDVPMNRLVMDLLAEKGAKLMEDEAINGDATGGDGIPAGAAAAREELEELKKDPDFMAKRSPSSKKYDKKFAEKVTKLYAAMNPERKQ